ncbi:MAG: type II/IV secretion system protein, partial [Patescibacteria group bacterium]|nr:type II/IV secretion system protein [Patescibacteria group bacterium]
GRFSARIDGRKVDFRVSTFPAYYGEKVEMRILDQERGVKKLDEIGMAAKNLALVKEAIDRPYGLILITGPTGSGKSTTLYSMLNEVDKESYNVLSLEDPVEYNMDGVSQSQVRPEIGYDFASGLRTTLRQDPDIIMVGEIRDKETAQLAVQAALTGHLVFSTLHTNNAAGVVPRLIDMGVDPYLIAPTLILAMAQRLVGLVCPGGGKETPIDGSIKMMIDHQFADLPPEFKKDIPFSDTVYTIAPTPDCPKGTRGRMAVFEMFKMDKDIENAILKEPTELYISSLLRKKGMLTMKEDALVKAFQKIIPFEEVNKL